VEEEHARAEEEHARAEEEHARAEEEHARAEDMALQQMQQLQELMTKQQDEAEAALRKTLAREMDEKVKTAKTHAEQEMVGLKVELQRNVTELQRANEEMQRFNQAARAAEEGSMRDVATAIRERKAVEHELAVVQAAMSRSQGEWVPSVSIDPDPYKY
jgi:hypothetical protein